MGTEGSTAEREPVRRAAVAQPAAPEQDRLGGGPAPDGVDSALRRRRGKGKPLPVDVADAFGSRLGADLSSVRVHTDGEADQLSRAVDATAFTHGSDIYFTQGTYAPSTGAGQHLLAHELTHVVQQSGGAPVQQASGGTTVGRADDPAEQEAERVAAAVVPALRRQAARVGPAVTAQPAVVQRWPSWSWFTTRKNKKSATSAVAAIPAQRGAPAPVAATVAVGGAQVAEPTVAPDTAPAPVVSNTPPAPAEVAETAAPVAAPEKAVSEASSPAPAPDPEPSKDKAGFTAVIGSAGAPADAAEAKERMKGLRSLLGQMSKDERAAISEDLALMAKARTFVGDHEYMSLVTAVSMARKPAAKKGKAAGVEHMSGAEADTMIQTELKKLPHLKPFLEAAVAAGKKADGFVAVVDEKDWDLIYGTQYAGKTASVDGLSTNAFIANTHEDRPAIIHQSRGTRSTAVHESMHRYSVLSVLHTFGSPLNEGITEFFTRKITDRDGKSASEGGPERSNYQSNVTFVRTLVSKLDADTVTAETMLAKIYFDGDVAAIETWFRARHKAKKTEAAQVDEGWTNMSKALKGGKWDDAKALIP